MIKNKTSVSYNRYNDGVAALYSVTGETTSFGAAKNVRALSDMEYICTVPFALQSCRVEDFDFAEENGFQLSRKVRMPLVSGIDNRKKAVINGLLGQGRTAYTDRYRVAVVREDYIPDGLAEKIIDAMEKIPGMKFADNLTGEYAYERKGNTNIVCEMLVLEFSRGRKKCANG